MSGILKEDFQEPSKTICFFSVGCLIVSLDGMGDGIDDSNGTDDGAGNGDGAGAEWKKKWMKK